MRIRTALTLGGVYAAALAVFIAGGRLVQADTIDDGEVIDATILDPRVETWYARLRADWADTLGVPDRIRILDSLEVEIREGHDAEARWRRMVR